MKYKITKKEVLQKALNNYCDELSVKKDKAHFEWMKFVEQGFTESDYDYYTAKSNYEWLREEMNVLLGIIGRNR